MDPEVRYQMLRPAQIVERRNECPAAYLPIGNLEWHGVHNPLGADTLQAEGLAVLCARTGGGLALPPLYYGESRLEGLMEANASDRDKIAEGMDLPPENFEQGRFPFTPVEQARSYQRLLIHVLAELDTLGFKVGVLVCGHYPLIDHARAAILEWNQRLPVRREGRMLAWACLDCLLVEDQYEFPGDHAGGWETSHLMELHPDTVDLGALPPEGEKLVGVGGKRAPQGASAEFGRETMEAAGRVAVSEVRHRLENRAFYLRHGNCLREGLWRK